MIVIPVQTPDHHCDALFIVLDDESIARLAVADPAECVLRKYNRTLVNPTILICHERETPEFKKLLETGDLDQIIAFLRRGFRFRPDLGDDDDHEVIRSGVT